MLTETTGMPSASGRSHCRSLHQCQERKRQVPLSSCKSIRVALWNLAASSYIIQNAQSSWKSRCPEWLRDTINREALFVPPTIKEQSHIDFQWRSLVTRRLSWTACRKVTMSLLHVINLACHQVAERTPRPELPRCHHLSVLSQRHRGIMGVFI